MSIHDQKLTQRLESLVTVTANSAKKVKAFTRCAWPYNFLYVMNLQIDGCIQHPWTRRRTYIERNLVTCGYFFQRGSRSAQWRRWRPSTRWPELKPCVGSYEPSSSVLQQSTKSYQLCGQYAAADPDLWPSWSATKVKVPKDILRYQPACWSTSRQIKIIIFFSPN